MLPFELSVDIAINCSMTLLLWLLVAVTLSLVRSQPVRSRLWLLHVAVKLWLPPLITTPRGIPQIVARMQRSGIRGSLSCTHPDTGNFA